MLTASAARYCVKRAFSSCYSVYARVWVQADALPGCPRIHVPASYSSLTDAGKQDPAEELSNLRPSAAAQLSYAELASTIYGISQKLGPVTLGDLVFGVQALAKHHAAQKLTYNIKGKELFDPDELLHLLEAADLAFGAYKRNPQSLCAVTSLPLHSIACFRPEAVSLQPAYFIAVDHRRRAIIWGIRGTKHLHDVLTDLCGSSTPFAGGQVHWGMWQACQTLLFNEMQRLVRLSSSHPGYELLLVGHSLGGGVAAIMSHLLNTRPALRRRLVGCPRVHAVCVGPAAVMSRDVAAACRPWVISLICAHDAVPRFSTMNVRRLQQELMEVDWYGELMKNIFEMEYVKAVSQALTTAGSTTADAAAQLQRLGSELLHSGQVQRVYDALEQVLYGRFGKEGQRHVQKQLALDTGGRAGMQGHSSSPSSSSSSSKSRDSTVAVPHGASAGGVPATPSSSSQWETPQQASPASAGAPGAAAAATGGEGGSHAAVQQLLEEDPWQAHRRGWRSEQQMLADQEEAWHDAWLQLSYARQGVEEHRLRHQGHQQQQAAGQTGATAQEAAGALGAATRHDAPAAKPVDQHSWQLDVLQQWVTDTAVRYLPQLSLPAVAQADINRMADAAVGALTGQLQQVRELLGPSPGTLHSTKQAAGDAVSSLTDALGQVREVLPAWPPYLPIPMAAKQQGKGAVDSAAREAAIPTGHTQRQQQQQQGPGLGGNQVAAAAAHEQRQQSAASKGGLPAASDDSEVSGSSHLELTELVQLYPPGRLLWLERATPPWQHSPASPGGVSGSPGTTLAAAAASEEPLADGEATANLASAADASMQAQTGPTASPAATVGVLHTGHRLVEVPEGDYSSFERVVLHPEMLSDHRMRNYRSGLLELLRAAVSRGPSPPM